MSRRETAVNVLLGCTLLLIFAGLVLVVAISALILFDLLFHSTAGYFARLGVSDDLWFSLLACSLALWDAVLHFRKRLWIDAFLCLALIPSMVLASLPGFASIARPEQRGLTFALLLLYLIWFNGRLRRWEIPLFAVLIAISTALNSGLFAPESLRLAEDGLLLVTAGWIALRVRHGDFPMQKANS